MASYSSPLNLQLPEAPRLNPRGKEDIAAEFQTVYNALRYLIQGIGNGSGVTVSWGSITGSLGNQLDLTAVLNTKLNDAPSDGQYYARYNGNWQSFVPGGGGSGTVTSVGTGTGLTGGPITTTGTISIANTAVSPGSYTNANITVNAQGQITAASNGSTSGGIYMPAVDGNIPPDFIVDVNGNLIYVQVA